ncbi:hypothetical protein Ddye_020702 [Dipteronia dyeriana]|uniref:HAT C-terminal dimerisation domain-containing protein n=1 Tax=Dipteronia dyeriana TaxID=168575 RepID=A0AAD9U0T9_9ROSI|nr:hypothetical protein Ddye_020702 [Dipteronia dyeriana]
MDLYLLERPEKLNEMFDVLAWWKNSLVKFPILSMIARDVFAIPISTVASKSAFSTGGRILDPFRSSLTPKIVEGLILTGNWLQTTFPIAEPRVVQEHAQNENESGTGNILIIIKEIESTMIDTEDLEVGLSSLAVQKAKNVTRLQTLEK